MKFLVDSCISKFAVESLRKEGFEVLWIPETDKDPGDTEIIKKAYTENLVLVTADKDFGELIYVFKKPHPAIIRLVNIRAKEQGKLLLKVINTYQNEINQKALITVDRLRVRVRLSGE